MGIQAGTGTLKSCSQCGLEYAADEMIEIENQLICFKCKPAYLQRFKEGVAPVTIKPRSIWWKVFFFIILILEMVSIGEASRNIMIGKDLFMNILELVVYPWVVIAIFGYAFCKRILVRKVWKILFPLAIMTDITWHYFFFTKPDNQYMLIIILIFYASLSPLIIFQYLALYRYGFSETDPWR